MKIAVNKRKWQRYGMIVLAVFLMALTILRLEDWLYERSELSRLKKDTVETDLYRAQILNEDMIKWMGSFSKEEQVPVADLLTAFMPEENFNLEGQKTGPYTFKDYKKAVRRWSVKKTSYQNLKQANEAIWSDLKYFPVPKSSKNPKATTAYDNSWQFERTYGGKRGHEGTDIMAGINKRGYYPVVSMTDGVVENIGWLEKGGYRIGIRSAHGGYFYYAHLHSYAEDFKQGDKIKAGQLIGYMGDSGYGKKEGTVGKFAVHLHMGIYIRTEHHTELSVNPYWILRYMDGKRLTFDF